MRQITPRRPTEQQDPLVDDAQEDILCVLLKHKVLNWKTSSRKGIAGGFNSESFQVDRGAMIRNALVPKRGLCPDLYKM